MFPELRDFRFVNTSIVDGDLTPLMSHPTLVNAGFLNKRHYNYKAEHVDSHLLLRKAKAEVWVSKGQFFTSASLPIFSSAASPFLGPTNCTLVTGKASVFGSGTGMATAGTPA